MGHDAVEPRDVTMAIGREVDVVIIVRRKMLMDGWVRMMGIGICAGAPAAGAADKREALGTKRQAR